MRLFLNNALFLSSFLFSSLPAASAEVLAPKMTIIAPVHDFGVVDEGSKIEAAFRVRNDGNSPLEVRRVQPACGCMSSINQEVSVSPGEEFVIPATFDTTGMNGFKVKTLRVFTNDPKNPSSQLTFRGTVKPELQVDPPRVYFGNVRRGQAPKVSFVVFGDSKTGPSIDSAMPRSEFIEVEEEELQTAEKKGKKFTVSLKDDVPLGILNSRIVIATGSSKSPSVPVPVFARVEGDLQLRPSDISFGLREAPLATALSGTVQLANQGVKALGSVSVESDNPFVTAKIKPLEPGRLFEIVVTLAAGYEGNLRTQLRVNTDHPDEAQQTLQIPVYAIVTKKSE
jgi:hypothetical protein